jgi:type VI secretion system protein VasI
MKSPGALLMLMLAAASCHAGPASVPSTSECTAIVSSAQRLACFDRVAGTPPAAAGGAARDDASAGAGGVRDASSLAEIIRRNEAARREGDHAFAIVRVEDVMPGQAQVLIWAPALDGAEASAYLAISCIGNISRLQLLLPAASDRNQIRVRLYIDDRPLAASRTWQVLEPGNVVDAGRGLVAIDMLRRFSPGGRLRVESDHAAVHGLMFDAAGLQGLIAQQREACHW